MKNRIIALFLVSVMLFGFASCDKADDKVVPPKDKDLTVEIQTVDYDDASVNEASERIADITARIVLNYYNKTLTDKEKADIGASFKSDILPSLKDIPVYCDELFELIECAEDYLAVGEENEEEYSTEFIFGLYKRFCKILDGERLGALVYEIEIFNLESNYDNINCCRAN